MSSIARNTFSLGFAENTEGVALHHGVDLGFVEVHDGVVVFEEVDLVDPRDILAPALAQHVDQLIVVGRGAFRHFFHLMSTHKNSFTFLRATPFPPIRVESPNLSANLLLASYTESIKII